MRKIQNIEEDDFYGETPNSPEHSAEFEYEDFDAEDFDDLDGEEEEDFDGEDDSDFDGEDDSDFDGDDEVFEDFSIDDIDFSDFSGKNFKTSLRKANKAVDRRKVVRKRPIRRRRRKVASKNIPLSRQVKRPTKGRISLQKRATKKREVTNIPVKSRATISGKTTKRGGEAKTMQRVIVPSDKKVIIEGVDKFMLSQAPQAELIKRIGYHKGKKLKELILILDNSNSLVDFDLELFNPSMPLDYLYSTSGNLNNKITTAGIDVSYSDVLFNILANPTRIHNAQVVFSGVSPNQQRSQALIVKQKNIAGYEKIDPIPLNIELDRYQFFENIVFFNIAKSISRPYIPNGMDVIEYKVLAGNICTFCFFYEQIDLRKVFYRDAANSKNLL